MGALTDLGQLLRIPEQQHFGGRRRDRDGVGQTELPRLVDHQQVQTARRHALRVGEIPSRTADYAAHVVVDEIGVSARVDLLPPRAGGALLGDECWIEAGVDHTVQQVLHCGV